MQPDPSHIYRAVFEQGPDAMVIVDTTGVIILINRKALEITGYQAAEELLGKNITHILSATDHNRFREYFGLANVFPDGGGPRIQYTKEGWIRFCR